ncbi:MAG: hypothetical protein J6B72_01795 [Clostridia bacterium]|nr:hypothetical protein [Clostridia bacterium]
MIECSGKTFFAVSDAVTGRMCRMGKEDVNFSDGARILIWDGDRELTEAALRGAVGVVFPKGLPDHRIKGALRIAEFCRLPVLRVNCGLDSLISDAWEKIAILDAAGQKLFVNPDLETINGYFGSRTRKKARNTCFMLQYEGSAEAHEGAERFDGIAVGEEYTRGKSEEEIYELLCDIADKNTGTQIVAAAGFGGTDEFCSAVRAIYRAGVWGRFSLLCCGVRTPEQADECISIIHREFCRLDTEGREFNGFIPKGIAVEAPLMLLSRPKHRMIDFFCADFDSLRRLLSGSGDVNVGQERTAEYISAFIKTAGDRSIALKGVKGISEGALRGLEDTGAISHIYASRQSAERIGQWI